MKSATDSVFSDPGRFWRRIFVCTDFRADRRPFQTPFLSYHLNLIVCTTLVAENYLIRSDSRLVKGRLGQIGKYPLPFLSIESRFSVHFSDGTNTWKERPRQLRVHKVPRVTRTYLELPSRVSPRDPVFRLANSSERRLERFTVCKRYWLPLILLDAIGPFHV